MIIKLKKFHKRLLFIIGVVILLSWILLGAASLAGFLFEKKYSHKTYPDIMIGNNNLGGLTREQIEQTLVNFQKNLETQGMVFEYKNKQAQLFPQIVAAQDLDLTYEIIFIDIKSTINNLFAIGRTGSFFKDLKTKLLLLKKPLHLKTSVQFKSEAIKNALRENFVSLERPAKDAELKINNRLKTTIIQEEPGILPNYDAGIAKLEENTKILIIEKIVLQAVRDNPKVTAIELNKNKEKIETLFNNNPILELRYNELKWPIQKTIYKDWLVVIKDKLSFNENLNEYIKENIAKKIETPVSEARFSIAEDKKVSEFAPSKDGLEIDYQATFLNINKQFFAIDNPNYITIVTKVIKPKYTTESINNLGIKEIIGTGRSNFAGSPKNRRHNISVGAKALNGILIPPGEEFSLISALGEIDADNGYLPELVIKGNKTIPEFGGGLCQIGTTIFRGALQSGLDITERRNHSYRVSYYEPAGTDCTIYSPKPDCKFINDTQNYILLQTYLTKKDELVFEFWGTKDGRKIISTKPVVYNITEPAPTKYIETEDLAVGETKCTERAHNGATAKFDYSVTYPDGRVKEKTFYSVYKPWQAVCLIGTKSTVKKNDNKNN